MVQSAFSYTKEKNKHANLSNKYLLSTNYAVCQAVFSVPECNNEHKEAVLRDWHSLEGKETTNSKCCMILCFIYYTYIYMRHIYGTNMFIITIITTNNRYVGETLGASQRHSRSFLREAQTFMWRWQIIQKLWHLNSKHCWSDFITSLILLITLAPISAYQG